MRGADILVEALAAHGVDRIFALSGNQIMPVFDACLSAGVRIIHTRHEAAAVFMAEAHAQLTGQIGVALVTAGAGFGNTIGALIAAQASETPVLLLSGDAPVATEGRGSFQELDQIAISAPVTKFNRRCVDSQAFPNDVAHAISFALSDRQGPVHLALPADALTHDAPAQPMAPITNAARIPDMTEVQAHLSSARRPLIITGPALSPTRAPGLADKLADATDCPVITMESPRGLNDPALGAFGKVLPEADLIVALGKSVDFTLGLGNQNATGPADWIVISTDKELKTQARANLRDRLRATINAAPKDAAKALLSAPNDPSRSKWREKVSTAVNELPARPVASDDTITSWSLCDAIRRHIEHVPNCIIVSDGGEFGQWAQAILRGTNRVINGPAGAIGGAIPQAIAAKIAHPDATVIALMGDGSAGFHLSEFETAAREDAQIIAVIGNDQRWNAEHLIQLRQFGPDRQFACDLSDARYDQAAAALGASGAYITTPDVLDRAIDQAITAQKPTCLNVMINSQPAPTIS